jgi:hypothetical protein
VGYAISGEGRERKGREGSLFRPGFLLALYLCIRQTFSKKTCKGIRGGGGEGGD